MMVAAEKRPKLYFDHAQVLDNTQLERPTLALYLHENLIDFFGDIGDLANTLEDYSMSEYVSSKIEYDYLNYQEIYELKNLGALIAAKSTTEYNLHVSESQVCGNP